MSADSTWREVEVAFHAAAELEGDARRVYLDALAAERPTIAREVGRLLAADDAPAPHLDPDDGGLSSVATAVGTRLGRFRIVERIGRGGMGTVYRAMQDEPRRPVALKVLSRLLDEPARARFRIETQVLARLRHPHIAQIYDAGVEDGVPWFAMELVSGRDLARHAQSLPLRSKLELFIHVCDAVHHAHQRGVVHRDLKPGNIIVDDDGAPKLLDFGIARVGGGEAETSAGLTTAGTILGTLAYMSPEQARGHVEEIDARSDIYSLGVVLYELLCGRLPYEIPTRVLAAVEAIAEWSPNPMRLGGRATSDLEAIVVTALRKEPDARYVSAAELAADLRRYLAHEPVIARPPTAGYHLARFARRHRLAVTLSSIALVSVIGGLLASLLFLARARDAADEAEQRRRLEAAARERAVDQTERAQELSSLLQDLISAAHPGVGLGREVRLRDLLGDWSERMRAVKGLRPSTRVASLNLLGTTFERLGYYDESLDVLERSVAVADAELAAGDDDRRRARLYLGQTLEALGRLDRALALTSAEGTRGAGDDIGVSMELLSSRILVQLDRFEEAERAARDAVTGATGAERRAEAASALAASLDAQGRNEEAADVIRRGLDEVAAELGERHPIVIALRCQRLGALFSEGRADEAADEVEAAVSDATEVLGRRHRQTLLIVQYAVRLRLEQGRLDEALPLARRLVAAGEEAWSQPTVATVRSRIRLGVILFRRRDLAEARTVLERAAREARDVLPPGSRPALKAAEYLTRTLVVHDALAEAERVSGEALTSAGGRPATQELVALARARSQVLSRLGRAAEGEALLRTFVESLASRTGFNRIEHSRLLNDLASTLHLQERFEDAEPMLRRVVEVRSRLLGDDHRLTRSARGNLAALLFRLGRLEETESITRALLAAAGDRPSTHAGRRLLLGLTLEARGLRQEALAELTSALAEARTRLPPGHRMVRRLRGAVERLRP